MTDYDLRRCLAQDLRRLVTGRATNYEYDDACADRYLNSVDGAVRQVSDFGWRLYGDLYEYRLRGRYALDRAMRRTAARCVLFLRTDLNYEWPTEPSTWGAIALYSLASLGIPTGIAILICSVPLLLAGVADVEFLWPVAAVGAFILAASLWYRFARSGFAAAFQSPKWRAWRSSGDFDVWPFFRRKDYYEARRTAHLLGTTRPG